LKDWRWPESYENRWDVIDEEGQGYRNPESEFVIHKYNDNGTFGVVKFAEEIL